MPRIRQLADKYAMKDLSAHIKGRIEASGRTQQDTASRYSWLTAQIRQHTVRSQTKNMKPSSRNSLRRMGLQRRHKLWQR